MNRVVGRASHPFSFVRRIAGNLPSGNVMAVLLAKLRTTRRNDHDVQDLEVALEVGKLLQLAALVWMLVT